MEKAGLGGKIEGLPQGYHTHLCKEVYEDAPEFSGGELQRLMMARLLYRDSPVMNLEGAQARCCVPGQPGDDPGRTHCGPGCFGGERHL